MTSPTCVTTTYAYDPFGRRIEKTVSNSGGHKVTRFDYDGEDLLFETDAEGRVGNRYLHGPGSDEPLALVNGKEIAFGNQTGAYRVGGI